MSIVTQRPLLMSAAQTGRLRNRKKHNQYFTPDFVVEAAYSLIPTDVEMTKVIDLAAGEGVFLRQAAKRWTGARLIGVDLDPDIVSAFKRLRLPNSVCFCADALSQRTWSEIRELRWLLGDGGFDLVAGNPPFSSWFSRVKSSELLRGYRLATLRGRVATSQAIEILFLEAFVRVARNGGFLVIVLPEGVLSNPQYRYVREFILEETIVRHIISLPRGVFRGTCAKTSLLVLQKRPPSDRAHVAKASVLEGPGVLNQTISVDQPRLAERMDHAYHYGLRKSSVTALANRGLRFTPLGDFVVHCRTGKTLYGKQRIFSGTGLRFLHATNVTEIGIDYARDERFLDPTGPMNSPVAHAKVGDILFVRVGVGCAGRAAIVDTPDEEGVATDYLHILRLEGIDPYFVVAYLKTRYGKDSIHLLKHGVATVSINKSDLLSIPVPVVPYATQKKIGEAYREIIRAYRRGLAEAITKQRLDSLLCQLDAALTRA